MPITAIFDAISGLLGDDIQTFKLMIALIMACFPAYIWGFIYYQKQPEPRKLVALTFVAGMLAVAPILLYKASWALFPQLEIFLHTEKYVHITFSLFSLLTIPLSVILAFMFVGVIEEYMKHFAVKMVDDNKFKCIDDAIEFSIIASLGFSFVENIMYFYFIWTGQGTEQFLVAFIFRSIFSTFAHILFSGVYGYYYGIAHFSTPIYQEEVKKKRFAITNFFHKITRMKSESIFHKEKVMEGLFMAVLLHAVFDIFLEVQWTYIILPYLVIGYLYLDYLFEKKEDHIQYGEVSNERAIHAVTDGGMKKKNEEVAK